MVLQFEGPQQLDPAAEDAAARSLGAQFAANASHGDRLAVEGVSLRSLGAGRLLIGDDGIMADAATLRRLAQVLIGAASVVATREPSLAGAIGRGTQQVAS